MKGAQMQQEAAAAAQAALGGQASGSYGHSGYAGGAASVPQHAPPLNFAAGFTSGMAPPATLSVTPASAPYEPPLRISRSQGAAPTNTQPYVPGMPERAPQHAQQASLQSTYGSTVPADGSTMGFGTLPVPTASTGGCAGLHSKTWHVADGGAGAGGSPGGVVVPLTHYAEPSVPSTVYDQAPPTSYGALPPSAPLYAPPSAPPTYDCVGASDVALSEAPGRTDEVAHRFLSRDGYDGAGYAAQSLFKPPSDLSRHGCGSTVTPDAIFEADANVPRPPPRGFCEACVCCRPRATAATTHRP